MKGFKELQKKLTALPRVAKRHMIPDALQELAEKTLAHAREVVPVDNGALRDSLDYELDRTNHRAHIGPRPGALPSGAVPEDYGEDVELGTSEQAAQPYLRPALDVANDESPRVHRDKLKDTLRSL